MRPHTALEHHSIHSLREQIGQLGNTSFGPDKTRRTGRHQRTRETPAARHGQHSCPSAPPTFGHCKTIGASRALAAARQLMNSTDSALHRPPVSTPTTTNLQRSPADNSAHLRSFSLLACNKTTPSVCDVFGTAAPDAVKTLRIIVSTANCAPWNNGRPLANTSMARALRNLPQGRNGNDDGPGPQRMCCYHGLLEVVLERRRRVILPTMLPLARLMCPRSVEGGHLP